MRLMFRAYSGALMPKTRVDYIEHLLSGVHFEGEPITWRWVASLFYAL